jgi:hypothetical protein
MKRLPVSIRMHRLFLMVTVALLVGCAGPSEHIKRAEDVSVAGITYTDTVIDLLDLTIERVISDDSDILIRQRKRLPENQLQSLLAEQDEALVPLVKAIGSFRDSTRKLKAYFLALQTLAETKVEDTAGPAIEELISSINSANMAIQKSETLVFTDEERVFVSNLGTLAGKSAKAGKLHAAIRNSATVIGEQSVLHEKLLERMASILEDSYSIETDKLHNKLRQAYVTKDTVLPSDWKNDRHTWVTTKFYVNTLENAIIASRVMKEKWESFVDGKGDAETIALLLADINEFLSAARGLRDVER